MYISDSGSRKPSSYISYEALFSSLACKDDGWMLELAMTVWHSMMFMDLRGLMYLSLLLI